MKVDLDKFLAPYRIEDGKGFTLKDHDPRDTHELGIEKADAKELLRTGIERLTELQEMLYAQNRWSVLLIFQAMDAAGKDSAIKHVMSGVNPQGVQVYAFKRPSAEELDHDFLWRCARNLPERGRIGVFNRSYYEEVLVVRVHQEILESQHLPPELVGKSIFDERLEDIANFERYLAHQGTLILKFFLNVSKAEQKKRFLKRLDDPEKHWKFEAGDLAERGHWDAYMDAYQKAIQATAAPHAPWYVVPADNKWFTRLVVAGAIVDSMRRLDLHFPKVSEAERAKFAEYRRALEAE
ncbi:MAG TPA: polyphosphate kinase 2 family protein [Geminicoccus sp.]|uniref:polyphosphate kinase 2 family protein n=1 Tax=Geminicoccus sp. TaxID=2024832 RepID=UPI002CF158AF|nr:polyphosphate kinase 2 family protein [Geminicoccus sp.]HWL68969.1 polyphosphate kinase 2 family protein [Geminicoccus sp.]